MIELRVGVPPTDLWARSTTLLSSKVQLPELYFSRAQSTESLLTE